jgi:hypothetical protein
MEEAEYGINFGFLFLLARIPADRPRTVTDIQEPVIS